MKIALLIDVSNLYYCIGAKYKSKLNYKALMEYIKPMGSIITARAYGSQIRGEATGFISALKNIGFECHFKTPKEYATDDPNRVRRKADWDVGIAMDMLTLAESGECDTVILGTADGDMSPAIEACISKGVKVIVIGCGISSTLKSITNVECIEIPRSLMEG